ncbi:MAG: hypothetical protein HY681_14735 [Chloroflexi bacterium]|nr:hypothetical protein [Chloroflexota bacterium]
MSNRLRFTVVMLVIMGGLLVVPAFLSAADYTPPHQKPGPASDRIRFQSFNVDLAGERLKAGDMDMYFFSLKTAEAQRLRNEPGITTYQAPATSISLLLNPAPAPQGELNPFSIKEVRYALQYAVNRQFIAQEIYKGLAQPMTAHVGPFDYDYLTVYEQITQEPISFDPDLARQLVTEAMTKAGATLQDGKWQFGGKPIQLKFIIRVEDERRDVGDLIRAQLETLGFSVAPSYQSFAPAVLSVYGSDPQLFQWHLYTEGWGRGAAERYDFGTINSMAAPWLGNMPGWQEGGFWQYQNDKLDELGKRLFQGSFKDQAERDTIYRDMTRLALDESVRLWLATIVNSLPASDKVQGVTQDISSGPKSIWTLREANVPGKDTITVGNLWVWTERTTWNPIGGFGDVYSNDVWQNLHDPPTWRDPFTGIPIPFRATYEVTTAGPEGKLDVPSGAFRWDASANKFADVGPGVKATSKVVYDYSKFFQSKWHHGQPITMADVVYTIYQSFDLAYNEDKSRVERAIAFTSRPFLETIKGYRIVDDTHIEVYADYWHFVPDYIAEYATPSGVGMPWEVLAGMDKLVFQDRKAAYSDTASQRYSVPWISLVMDNDSRLLRRALIEMRDSNAALPNVFTVGGKTLVTPAQAKARYDATIQWIGQRGMAVISNGPYVLAKYDPPAQFAELEAYRDPGYPFKPGDWYKGSSAPVVIESVQPGQITPGSPAKVSVRLQGPGEVAVRYLLVDQAAGKAVASGVAAPQGQGQFQVELSAEDTNRLAAGPHQLFLVASSDKVSSLAERRIDLQPGATQPQPQPTVAAPTATPTPAKKSGGFSCAGPPLPRR